MNAPSETVSANSKRQATGALCAGNMEAPPSLGSKRTESGGHVFLAGWLHFVRNDAVPVGKNFPL